MEIPILRLQAALSRSGITKADGPFDDDTIQTSCPTCHTMQVLGEAQVRSDGRNTFYRCRNGCQDILVISIIDRPGPVFGTNRAHPFLIGGLKYAIYNASDVFIPVGGNQIALRANHGAPLDPQSWSPQPGNEAPG